MADDPLPDPEHVARMAWITRARRLHRNKRMIGFAGIVLGAAILMWWKADAAAPQWALWGGAGVLFGSWLLFIYVMVARWRWVKKNPYPPHGARS